MPMFRGVLSKTQKWRQPFPRSSSSTGLQFNHTRNTTNGAHKASAEDENENARKKVDNYDVGRPSWKLYAGVVAVVVSLVGGKLANKWVLIFFRKKNNLLEK
jgi:hypothetical protein